MVAVVFPGQGSQKPGMGRELVEQFPEAGRVFDEVSDAVGRDVRILCFESDEESLRQTDNAQIALFTCSVAALRCSGVQYSAAAGHSVGEYAALVAAGVVSLVEAAKLVAARGELMASSGSERPGGMAAILNLDFEPLHQVCVAASVNGEVAVIANDNSPGQLVISGDKAAVQRACDGALAKGAKRAIILNVSGAFHSPLMAVPAESMAVTLQSAKWSDKQSRPVYANVTASPVSDPSAWAKLLEQQLKNPVRWRESILAMVADGYDTFVELGSGEVLCGLIRRIAPEVRTVAVYDGASLLKAQEALSVAV